MVQRDTERPAAVTSRATSSTFHVHVLIAAGPDKSPDPAPVSLCLSDSSSVFHSFSFYISLCLSLHCASFCSVAAFPQISSTRSLALWDLVWSPTSTPAARLGRAGVIQQQGHTDWRAVRPDAFCFTVLCVCLGLCVCVYELLGGGMDAGTEKERKRGEYRPGKQLCFCWVYIINVLLNRTVSTHSIISDHKCKYCLEDKRGTLSKCPRKV